MRARAIREGSVGLLILVGVVLFGGLVLWLRGLSLGSRNYNIIVAFKNTAGMLVGTSVRYRGVTVGRVIDIQPGSNQVDVWVEITQANLRIPQGVRVEANQSGFIGETAIDITPNTQLSDTEQAMSPTADDCDSELIICDGDRLEGQVGVNYESLLRSAETLANTLTDPTLVNNIRTTLENAALFAEQGTILADELTELALTAKEEIGPLSSSVQQATDSTTAAAQQIQLTATDARRLLEANQFNLTNTLDNLNRGSSTLASLVDTVAADLDDSSLLDNLEVLSANAAQASANLRNASVDLSAITSAVNQPENLLLLQQTLESARDVFQSAQKILSDVDELTGDPAIRNGLRDLINGLTDLLSSTQVLEQQIEVAGALAPLSRVTTSPLEPNQAPAAVSATSAEYQKLRTQLESLAAHSQLAADE